MTVTKRTDPYFGPKITLYDDSEEQKYRLVPHGFAHDPVLWRAVTDDPEGTWVTGWERVGEVTVEVVDVAPTTQCECGEVLDSQREKRMALISGVCPHDD